MQNLSFKMIKDFKCPRCGFPYYDKLMFTGDKSLNDENSIIFEKYVCRNCDFPVNINDYECENNDLQISSQELIKREE